MIVSQVRTSMAESKTSHFLMQPILKKKKCLCNIALSKVSKVSSKISLNSQLV